MLKRTLKDGTIWNYGVVMNKHAWCRALLLVPLFVLLIVPLASADMIVQLDSVTPCVADPSCASYYDFNYSVTVSAGDGLLSTLPTINGTFVTIYDVPGIVTVEGGLDWSSASSGPLGVTPTGLNPTDDPTINNVTFKNGSQPGTGQPVFLGTIRSLYGNVATGQFSWQDFDAYPVSAGSLQSGLGQVGVPSATPSAVPEPSSLILLGSGLAACVGAMKRKFLRSLVAPDRD